MFTAFSLLERSFFQARFILAISSLIESFVWTWAVQLCVQSLVSQLGLSDYGLTNYTTIWTDYIQSMWDVCE